MGGGFCSQYTKTITNSNFTESYFTINGTSSLPNSGTGFPGSGTISYDTIESYVNGTLLANLPANLDASELLSSIQDEYCFYYKRYMFALKNVLTLAATSGTDMSTGSTYDSYKQNSIHLNRLLNQLVQILQVIQDSDMVSDDMPLDLDSVNDSLQSHMNKLIANDMEENAKSAMIDYTVEKNASSRNLLAIYGFMNIVAIGMLVYLYRTA
jgi:hypothetical protein